jgi:spectinomycin phosphotransferase
MREPPDLADAVIVTALRDGFGIHVDELVFLPVGNDAASSAYQVRVARGPDRFLKIRAGRDARAVARRWTAS